MLHVQTRVEEEYWEKARNLASYLIVDKYENTIHYDYARGDDKFNLLRALDFLAQQHRLGHGTLNSDKFGSHNGTDDYDAALSLLGIIISGEIIDSCVNDFGGSSSLGNPYQPDRYGTFFTVLKELSLDFLSRQLGNTSNVRFSSIPSKFHEMYLVPREKERLFFYHEIWEAKKSGIISLERAREASLALVTPYQIGRRKSHFFP